MNNDVLLVPINVEQPNVETQSDVVVYVPQAHKNKAGIVKEGDGINIENGVVSLNRQTVEDMIDANKWVSYGFEQNLTEDEKGIARHNIGAGDNDFTGSWLDLANRPQTTVDFAENERKKSKNFFDVNTFLSKSTHTTVNGNVIAQAGDGLGELSSVWDLIPVSMFYSQQSGIAQGYAQFFMNIKTTGDRIVIFRFYDKNKNLVVPTTTPMFWRYDNNYKGVWRLFYNEDVVGNINLNDLDPNDGIEYIAFCTSRRAYSQTISNVMITIYNDVGELSDYQPYYGQISRKGDSEIRFAEMERQKSKNLLFMLDDNTTIVGINIKKESASQQLTFNGTASGVNEARIGYIKPITLRAGHTYVLSFKVVSGYLSGGLSAFVYDTKRGLWDGPIGVALENPKSITKITPTEDVSFDAMRWYVAAGTVCDNYVVALQLEENDVATDLTYPSGAITHNNAAPVTFAESERQKSKNLFNINDKILKTTTGVVYSISDDVITITTAGGFVGIKLVIPANTQVVISWEQGHTVKLYDEQVRGWLADIRNGGTYTNDTDEDLICAIVVYGEGTYSKLQVEKGSVATDYQPYNGAIVHEENIADVEHNKIVYDRYSNDSNLNKGYTGGVPIESSIDVDFTNVKKVIVYSERGSDVGIITEIDLENKSGSYGIFGGNVVKGAGNYFIFHSFRITNDKTSLSFEGGGYMYYDEISYNNETSSSNNRINKIITVV